MQHSNHNKEGRRKMLKRQLMMILLVLSIGFVLGACSNKDEGSDMDKENAYTSARIAEDKVNTLFATALLKDEKTPILDPVIGTEAKAKELLLSYFDESLVDKILAHYITDQKDGDNIIVNNEPFFSASILSTSQLDDVKIEGSKKEYTLTTSDQGVYSLKWIEDDDKYVVSNYEKK
ncbi:hypothetical protein [Paenibacillus montanisoli]|uniref:Uncharacterized protein n=1 Tax=Paenibacillus montanisoli TaxID=2081970 RepID=A0A328U6W8_9BACL|nr:hypothetical protein [Paenibacillus montanisoli]RAP75746.1 hypothetical protein DL346_09860 [Paenibacillus montanisoli]